MHRLVLAAVLAGAAVREIEPNDTMRQATDAGTIDASRIAWVAGLAASASDVDFYRFEPVEPGNWDLAIVTGSSKMPLGVGSSTSSKFPAIVGLYGPDGELRLALFCDEQVSYWFLGVSPPPGLPFHVSVAPVGPPPEGTGAYHLALVPH